MLILDWHLCFMQCEVDMHVHMLQFVYMAWLFASLATVPNSDPP